MTSNLRESFRVDAHFQAELFHEGRVVPCEVTNLSSGGAAVTTALEMPAGAQCTLGLRLEPDLQRSAGVGYVSFHMEVLQATPIHGGDIVYRLRNVTGSGSKQREMAAKLVVAAQRRALAVRSGAEPASRMVSDPERRRDLRSRLRERFSSGSTRPGSD